MDLGDVMDEVAVQLRTIDSLSGRTYAYPQATVVPPAAIVGYPTIPFDETYARGMDRFELPVWVVVGRPADRSTRDRIAIYCNGSGASSVKAVLESGTYTAFDTLRVVDVAFDAEPIAGAEYMTAKFTLDITGSGA